MNVRAHSKKIIAGALFAISMFSVSTGLTGCLTDDNGGDSTKSTPLGVETSIPAGAQAATLGSVLDLDTKTALTSEQANAAQGSIDLVFMYYAGAFHLDNAVAARTAGIANSINLTNTYDLTKIKDIKVVKVTAKPKDQETAKANLTKGTASASNIIVGGEMFLVMTTEGKVALVTVGPIVGTDNKANAQFKVILNTI